MTRVLRRLFHRSASFVTRRRDERRLREEIDEHLAQQTDENVRAGMSLEEARRQAVLKFGGVEFVKESYRDLQRLSFLGHLFYDARYAARTLRRNPGFTAAAMLTLALGIGANTAIFSVLHGVLLKPLPLDDPERLVAVWHSAPGLNMPLLEQGAATYFTYRENNRVFEDIALWNSEEVSITGHAEPERVQALQVTDGVLPILQVPPLHGRLFTKDDDAPGSPRRAILTHGYWQRRFGGAVEAIGRSLTVNGRQYEVIGILPPTFRFLRTDVAVVLPFRFNRAEVRAGDFSYRGLARLKSGVTLEQANADVARMIPLTFDRFAMWPGLTRKMFEEARLGPNVRPLSQDVIGEVGRVLWILAGTVGIVLLIACANVANLFLVRAEGRQQEFAIRVALGASRRRVARQLLCESVGLALVGGALGLVFAWAGIRLLATLAPTGLPRVDEIGIDAVVLGFTFAISILTGLLFGLIPVMRFGTSTVALTEGGRSATDTSRRHWARNALVVSEIALALVLLIVSGLMVRTFVALRQVEPGFARPARSPDIPRLDSRGARRRSTKSRAQYEQITQRLQQVPGVVSVGLSSSVTMDGNVASTPIFVEEFPEAGREMPPLAPAQARCARLFRDNGQPRDRRPCNHLG